MNKSKFLKLLGGFLFLTSFIAQTFTYDHWENESQEFYNSNRDFSDMIRSSLHYQNLYFNVKTTDSTLDSNLKQLYIQTAARKIALGNITSLTTSGLAKDSIVLLSNQIMNLAASVHDYKSYVDFLFKVNDLGNTSLKTKTNRVNEIGRKKAYWKYGFLASYIIGSLFLLLGTYYEK